MLNPLDLPLSIAPMIDWTYTHFRVLMRILAPRALLYTEMQTPAAILHQPERCLSFSPMEYPLALQLGGMDPKTLIVAAQQAEQMGYSEINLNLGCPSDRVLSGRFGACLMAEPVLVAKIIAMLKQAVSIPVTIKTRIGIDHQDSFSFFSNFIYALSDAGCDKFIIHARKAWLKGLSPKQNRTIPPVQYDYVYRIKAALPHIPFVINGNIQNIDAINTHLQNVDGIMLGRLACDQPYIIAEIHHALYPDIPLKSRARIASEYITYLQSIDYQEIPISLLLKPLMNLAHGLSNAKHWKQGLLQIQSAKSLFPGLEDISVFFKKTD